MKKYILLIADGCADQPQKELGGKTPLMASEKPNIDHLARRGVVGCAKTVPDGISPGSDTAILSIFGYDPRVHYSGRSPLEAAGSDVVMHEGNLSFRLNLASVQAQGNDLVMRSHSGGNIEGQQALALMDTLLCDAVFAAESKALGMNITVQPSFRHIAVMDRSPGDMVTTPPHEIIGQDIHAYLPSGAGEILKNMILRSYELLKDHSVNQTRIANGQLPANIVWPWGQGQAIVLPSFESLYGKKAVAISAVPLVWGIANLCGVALAKVPTATGDLHTDYEAKADAAVKALAEGADCAILHVEAPDECSHDGDLQGKIEAIHRIDSRMIPRLVQGVAEQGNDLCMLVLSDHYTLLSTRGHDATPVPYMLYDSCKDSMRDLPYDEQSALQGPRIDPATDLLRMLFQS